MDCLNICKCTRQIAAETLYTALSNLLSSSDQISEVALRDLWLVELQKEPSIFANGWYTPPPGGIGVLFGKEGDNRLDYDNLRAAEVWPREDRFLDRDEGLIYAFASPVDKDTGILGDFGVTLYFGKNVELQSYLKDALRIVRSTNGAIQPGQTLADVYNYTQQQLASAGYISNMVSVTSDVGDNIGHTVPIFQEDFTGLQEGESLTTNNFVSAIRHSRIFIGPLEELKIKPEMALTIEPRPRPLTPSGFPMVSYHTICLIHVDGVIEGLEDFEKLFGLVGMGYMIEV